MALPLNIFYAEKGVLNFSRILLIVTLCRYVSNIGSNNEITAII